MVAVAAETVHIEQACKNRGKGCQRIEHDPGYAGQHAISEGDGAMMSKMKFLKNPRVAAAKGVSFSATPELKVSLSPFRSRLVLFLLFL